MKYLKLPFVLFENFLLSFCNQPEPFEGTGGRKDGMTDEERDAEGDGRVPTLKECLTKK